MKYLLFDYIRNIGMRKVTEEQYKNALDEKKIREEMRVYWKDYFKNKKE